MLEPAYKATITDLLTPDQYSKASGLVQVAGSAKYLISPILAGFLLKLSDIRLLLILDICTFFVTVATTMAVRKGLHHVKVKTHTSFVREMKEGFHALTNKKGIFTLVVMGSLITFCLGIIQTLVSPLILSFSNSSTLGTLMTVITLGMLVSSVLLGGLSIERGIGFLILLAGMLLCVTAVVLFGMRSIRELEE